MKVIYKTPEAGRNHRLTLNRKYPVVGLDDEHFRVINDNHEPILYPREIFEVADPLIPSNWRKNEFEEGAFYIDPPECSEPGFYEDYFDDDPKAIATFNSVFQDLIDSD